MEIQRRANFLTFKKVEQETNTLALSSKFTSQFLKCQPASWCDCRLSFQLWISERFTVIRVLTSQIISLIANLKTMKEVFSKLLNVCAQVYFKTLGLIRIRVGIFETNFETLSILKGNFEFGCSISYR